MPHRLRERSGAFVRQHRRQRLAVLDLALQALQWRLAFLEVGGEAAHVRAAHVGACDRQFEQGDRRVERAEDLRTLLIQQAVRAHVEATILYGGDPALGVLFVAAPVMVAAGLPAWWLIGGVIRWLDRRRDKDIGEIVHDAVEVVKDARGAM